MTNLKFIGVWMTPDIGETVSFVLNHDDVNILVDCSTNLVGGLKKAKIDPLSITHIFITHTHGDHISGLPTYLFYRLIYLKVLMGKDISPLTILGSKATIEAVKAYIDIPYKGFSSNPLLKFEVVSAEDSYIINDIKLNFVLTKHNPTTYGVQFEINNTKICYTSDTIFDECLVKSWYGADYLLHDVAANSLFSSLSKGHTLCEEISKILDKYKIKNFIPLHRLSYYDSEKIEQYKNSITQYYKTGKTHIINDGDSIVIDM